MEEQIQNITNAVANRFDATKELAGSIKNAVEYFVGQFGDISNNEVVGQVISSVAKALGLN